MSVASLMFISLDSSSPDTEKLLKLSPTIAYSIRKLLRQNLDRLQSVIADGAALKADDFSHLDDVIHSLYLEPQEVNSVIHQLEQLAMSHQALNTQNNQFIEQRKHIEEKIFWLLGYKLHRSQHQGTIFVIDDTPAYVRFLSSALIQQGYEVCSASNGTTGLRLVQNILPDLILLDIMMPGIDGFEVCKRLKARSQTQEIPIIFLSGTSDLADKIRAFEAGGIDYIVKPFEIDEVLARLKIHLQSHTQQKQLREQNARLEEEVKERRQAEERYRSFFENSVDGMFQATLDGKFLRANSTLAKLYRYDSAEELVAAIDDIGHQLYVNPSDRIKLITMLEQTGSVIDFETQVYCKDGTILWISKSVKAVRDQFDHLLFYEGTVKNLTQRKRTEEALDRNQQLLQEIVDKTDALIFAKEYLHTDGTYLLVNRKFADQFHINLDEYFGKSDYDFFSKAIADSFRQADQQVLESQIPIHVEETVPTQNGDRISLVTKFPLLNSEGQIYAVCGIATDISDRKQSETELYRTKQHLQQHIQRIEQTLEDLKKHQVSVLQHERLSNLQLLFGSVMELQKSSRSIHAQLRSSQQQIQDLQQELQNAFQNEWISEKFTQTLSKLSVARSEIDTVHQLTNALSNYCRPDPAELSEIDIHECIDNVLYLLSSQLKAQFIQVGDTEFLRPAINVIQAYGYLPRIKCYPGQLHQLFWNVIVNAIEAMQWSRAQSGSIPSQISSKLEIQTLQTDANEIVVRIIDQGIGIPAEIQAKIFEPYFTTKSKSQGVGLAICARIVSQHRGRIEVTSAINQGTELKIKLPIS